MFFSLRRWINQLSSSPRRGRRPQVGRPCCQPRIDHLEDRLAPAVIPFINTAGGAWETPSNWQGGVLPGPNDEAVIGLTGITVTHTAGAPSISRLTVNGLDSVLNMRGGVLHVATHVGVSNNFTVRSTGGTLVSLNTITAVGGNLAVSGGGTLTATGALNLANSNVTVAGGTLNALAASSITGTSMVTLSGGTLSAQGTFNVSGGGTVTISGGRLSTQGAFSVSGGTLNYLSGTLDFPPTLTSGTLGLGTGVTGSPTFVVHGNSTLTGSVPAGVTVRVEGHGGFGGNATLNAQAGASNNGTIILESTFQGWASGLAGPTTGAFTNAAGGVILANAGTGGSRFLAGNLINRGMVRATAGTSFTMIDGIYEAAGGMHEGASQVYNSQLRVSASPPQPITIGVVGNSTLLGNNLPLTTLWVQGNGSFAGGNATLNVQAGASNTGTILLQSSYQGWASNLAAPSSGVFTNAVGGVIEANAGTGGGRTVTGNLTNRGLVRVGVNEYLTLTAGVYEAAGGQHEGATFVHNSELRVTASPAGGTTIGIARNTTLLGNNLAGTTLWVQGNGSFSGGHATLSVQAGASNFGTILLQSSYQSWDSNLAIPSGTFTNAAGGVIQASAGTGGTRTVTGNLTNRGLIRVTAGEILGITGGVYEAAGGLNEGAGLVYNAQVRVTASPPEGTTVGITRDTTLLGNNLAGTTLWVQGHGSFSGGHATLTVQSGAINEGTIRLASSYQGWNANLVVDGGGTLNNITAGVIQVSQGTGGSRSLIGQLVNAGTVEINTSVTLGGTGGTENHVSTGTLRLANDATLSVRGNSIVNEADGVIEGDGVINTLFSGGAAPLTNRGTVRVPTGALLRLVGPFQNFSADDRRLTGGTYFVTGTLRFDGANIETLIAHLTLNSPGSQVQNSGGGNALTNLATIRSLGGSMGSFTINGRNFDTSNAVAEFRNESTLNVSGGSTFRVLRNYTQTAAAEVNVYVGRVRVQGAFTNFASGTLTGGIYRLSGSDEINRGTFQFTGADITTNAARIELDGPGSEIIDPNGNDGLRNFTANQHTLALSSGRNLTIAGEFTNSGDLSIAAGATLTAAGGVNLTGGSLSGSGTVVGDVTNAGRVVVGGAGTAGTLTIVGNYVQTADGTLEIDIGGAEASSEYDVLYVNGTASLAGTLQVTLMNGYDPTGGLFMPLITEGGLSGVFDALTGDGPLFTPSDDGFAFYLQG